MKWFGRLLGQVVVGVVVPASLVGSTLADEKTVILDTNPRPTGKFEVAPDGSHIYFSGSNGKYLVYDDKGQLVDQYGVQNGSSPRELIPASDGWFIEIGSYAGGHVARYRPDGTLEKNFVGKGAKEDTLRGDMTGWTSPTGGTIDLDAKLVFALDTTQAPKGDPDPDWSRIAVFDFDGKFIRSINAHDNKDHPNEAGRVWYDDIEVDPKLKHVFATTRAKEMLVFDYEGKSIGKVPGFGGIAVFPDGRIATGADKGILIYSPDLQPVQLIETLPDLDMRSLAQESRMDLETDAGGRLYLSGWSQTLIFVRWSADLKTRDLFAAPFRKIDVSFTDQPLVAGKAVELKVVVTGNPKPEDVKDWHVMFRPSDGRDLRWQNLETTVTDGALSFTAPVDLMGLYDVAIRYGAGPINWTDRAGDLYVQHTFAVLPDGATQSVAIIPSEGRTGYRQGEAIPFQLIIRPAGPPAAPDAPVRMLAEATAVKIDLVRADDSLVATMQLKPGVDNWTGALPANWAAEIPKEVTRRLLPGTYRLKATAEGFLSYPIELTLAAAESDSPLQRILYHEFDQNAITMSQPTLGDTAERLSYVRDYVRATRDNGWTRETDRLVGKLDFAYGPGSWRREFAPANLENPAFAPPESYGIPHPGTQWEAEYYLDKLAGNGMVYDSQFLGHCSSIRFEDRWFPIMIPPLQRAAQWFGRYPSFYGFNYNDEMFFTGYSGGEWTDADKAWLERVKKEKFEGKPDADHLVYASRVMYDHFNAAVKQVDPNIKITAAPMWQFPAVEGSYAPSIYQDMSETYTHFLSEGYSVPWYPPQSIEMLRRPGLPIMGVIDNGYGSMDGERYMKDIMLVAARGVQGAGVEHTRTFEEPTNASALRTTNEILKMYGPIFAEVAPANEGSVLYSYTQDVTEQRNMFGTPHWERVYSLLGAGWMAGVPMDVVYEEDVIADRLLDGGKPRTGMLFLVGQKETLPPKVVEAINRYQTAGGKVFTDRDSADFPSATKLDIDTHETGALATASYAADSAYPMMFEAFEKLAALVKKTVGDQRRFPIDTDDPWISKNHFDGGDVQYVMLATETSPYPWDAGTVWSTGAMYNKNMVPWLPKVINATIPDKQGLVYDVFEHRQVKPSVLKLSVDLRTFPARLYAIAKAAPGAPTIQMGKNETDLSFSARISIAGQVPLRIRLLSGETILQEMYRVTDRTGVFNGSMPLPVTEAVINLEITEMLMGESSIAPLPQSPAVPAGWITGRPAVEIQREQQIHDLIKSAVDDGITLILPKPEAITEAQRADLQRVFDQLGVTLKFAATAPKDPTPGVYLAIGMKTTEPFITAAWAHGQIDTPLSNNVPCPGRGIVTAVFSPRGYQEHAILLIGGDADGVNKTIDTFVTWLGTGTVQTKEGPAPIALQPVANEKVNTSLPKLSGAVGIRLTDAVVSADGKHLVVGARGYNSNVALIEDAGESGKLVRAARIGEAPTVGSLFVSDDASAFGASSRYAARFGQGFNLIDAGTGSNQLFAGFGDLGRTSNHFASSGDAKTILSAGTFGVVCWNKDGNAWKEAWSVDYWKTFKDLDWPVSSDAERIPQFHAYIPRGADYALVCFAELSNQGWVTPENHGVVTLSALNLSDGKERWKFDVPVIKTLLFPTLYTSPDGSKLLLQVQMGSWGKETYRFYSIDSKTGKSIAEWDSKLAPQRIVLDDRTGMIAAVFDNRSLVVRQPDGAMTISRLWTDQPVSLAFSPDGQGIYLADDAGNLSLLDDTGAPKWSTKIGQNAGLTAMGERIYAACWDGRVRAFDQAGKSKWTLDLTPSMLSDQPMSAVVESAKNAENNLHEAKRPTTASSNKPDAGKNLLAAGGTAKLTVGGIAGWMSGGQVDVKPESLTNGQFDDVNQPWFNLDELFWNGQAGRQVWAEITFEKPNDVKSITVYENPSHPDSFPTESLVQVWDDAQKKWQTAARGLFMEGPINTYELNLKNVTKLRYVPWNSYYRNFYTSEIEVR